MHPENLKTALHNFLTHYDTQIDQIDIANCQNLKQLIYWWRITPDPQKKILAQMRVVLNKIDDMNELIDFLELTTFFQKYENAPQLDNIFETRIYRIIKQTNNVNQLLVWWNKERMFAFRNQIEHQIECLIDAVILDNLPSWFLAILENRFPLPLYFRRNAFKKKVKELLNNNLVKT